MQPPAVNELPIANLHQALKEALKKIEAGDLRSADESLASALAASSFNDVPPLTQHGALYLAGAVALELQDQPRALVLLKRSTTIGPADGDEWFLRMRAAYDNDDLDAIECLAKIASDFPQKLGQIHEQAIFRLVHLSKESPESAALRFILLDGLFSARWKAADGREPSYFWLDLVRHHLELGNAARAIEVSYRMSDPETIVALRVDNRFAPVREANAARLDVSRAARDAIEYSRVQSRKAQRKLDPAVQYAYALLANNQFARALAFTDRLIAKARKKSSQPAFDDMEDEFADILGLRARALWGLKRFREAERQHVAVGRLLFQGTPNISAVINLGEFYCRFDRSADALAAIALVENDVNQYGQMDLQAIRLTAALAQGDRPAAQHALAFLREHRDVAPNTFMWSLVRARELDEAAAYLVRRLEDPKLRHEALIDIQQYREGPATPRMKQWRESWHALLERQEVRDAVARVGRIERFDIAAPDI